MRAGKLLVYLAAVAPAAAAFAFALALMRDGEAPPERPDGRNLFSLVKPLDYPAPASQGARYGALPAAVLPDAIQAAREVAAVQAAAQRMRAQGTGTDEIERMRAAALQADTAARLARLDSAEAQWNSRFPAYLDERGTNILREKTLHSYEGHAPDFYTDSNP